MSATATRTAIRRVSYSDILQAPNAQQLIDEYAAECSVPSHDPQVETYAVLEQAGALVCFGAYVADELIGFVSVLTAVMPHHGKRVATIESLFVALEHREHTGAGTYLLHAAELQAAESECAAILYTARVGSILEKILARRAGLELSHSVFTRWL